MNEPTTTVTTKTKRRRRSAEEKWQIYLATMVTGAKIGDILRTNGMYSSELQTIRDAVKLGALNALSASKPGKKKVTMVPKDSFDKLQQEITEKEHAFAELMVMFTALKKKVNLE